MAASSGGGSISLSGFGQVAGEAVGVGATTSMFTMNQSAPDEHCES
jgi:hypothetical protein